MTKMTTNDVLNASADAYMSPVMLEYFRDALLTELKTIEAVLDVAPPEDDGSTSSADKNDQASHEETLAFNFKAKERAGIRKVKILHALKRIAEGEYGYSEHSGDEIGVRRMLAEMTATLTVDEQDRLERSRKMYAAA